MRELPILLPPQCGLKSEPDDVQWEKLDYVRLILANGDVYTRPEQVATKVTKQMLESGRAIIAGSAAWDARKVCQDQRRVVNVLPLASHEAALMFISGRFIGHE